MATTTRKIVSAADRGKSAESKVKAKLKSLEKANTTHHRFPDRRSGSMVTAPADFMILREGRLTLLEVKEVKHDSRLPYGNFSQDQIARMRLWALAGANTMVLVHHSTTGEWRDVPLEFFMTKDASRPSGSWNLSELDPVDFNTVFDKI